jgi:hypothetical protein
MSKWMPTGLGAEPKKMMLLIALAVIAPFAYHYGTSTDTPVTPPSSPKTGRVSLPVVDPTVIASPTARPAARASNRGGNDDFHPSLKLPENFDLSKVDPTLRTDLLARVREVGDVGASRSLFEFYTPPPPPPPKVDPIKPTAPKVDPAADAAIKANAAKPAVPPPPPPIPLKYFGYEGTPRAGGRLRALFVDGEENFVVGENDTIKNRYRIVRIGTTSAEVEDTVSKNTQTLRILDRQDP